MLVKALRVIYMKMKLKRALKGQMQVQLNTHFNESQNRHQNGNGNQNSNILLIASPGRTGCQETRLSLSRERDREGGRRKRVRFAKSAKYWKLDAFTEIYGRYGSLVGCSTYLTGCISRSHIHPHFLHPPHIPPPF